ncbi:MAG: hypothetical protein M1834_006911 [Cirrosporium novae-zelandiae]|nr:MAG: hypothetical protein M1834_006911 [Cirrosporium novae-zelandiae]
MSSDPSTIPGSSWANSEEAFQNYYILQDIPFDKKFKCYTKRDPLVPEVTCPYKPQDAELISPAAASSRNGSTYLSFGENGTTASVTEWGQLMQMSSVAECVSMLMDSIVVVY